MRGYGCPAALRPAPGGPGGGDGPASGAIREIVERTGAGLARVPTREEESRSSLRVHSQLKDAQGRRVAGGGGGEAGDGPGAAGPGLALLSGVVALAVCAVAPFVRPWATG